MVKKNGEFLALPVTAGLWLTLYGLVSPPALQAGSNSLITASGSMPATAAVVIPPVLTSNPSQIAVDGLSMTIANPDPVEILANVPSRLELSPLELSAPSGVDMSQVAAEISLTSNGSTMVGASTSSGGSNAFGVGRVLANVNARFYSTANQPLRPGLYRVSTVLSVIAD